MKKTVSILPAILAAFALNACNVTTSHLDLMQTTGDDVAGTDGYEVQRHRISESALVDSSDYNFNGGLNSDGAIEQASRLFRDSENGFLDKDFEPGTSGASSATNTSGASSATSTRTYWGTEIHLTPDEIETVSRLFWNNNTGLLDKDMEFDDITEIEQASRLSWDTETGLLDKGFEPGDPANMIYVGPTPDEIEQASRLLWSPVTDSLDKDAELVEPIGLHDKEADFNDKEPALEDKDA